MNPDLQSHPTYTQNESAHNLRFDIQPFSLYSGPGTVETDIPKDRFKLNVGGNSLQHAWWIMSCLLRSGSLL